MGDTAISPAHHGGQNGHLPMATHYLEPGQRPEGVALAHTLYGQPDESVTNAWAQTTQMGAVQIAPEGEGVPYIGDAIANRVPAHPEPVEDPRAKRCRAKNDTCMGWRISDSDFCAAHAGKLYDRWQRAREAEAAETEPS